MNLERYESLRRKVEQLRREQAKAEGAWETALQRLEEEFGCKTLKRAESLLERKEQELAAAEEAFNTALEAFESKWSSILET